MQKKTVFVDMDGVLCDFWANVQAFLSSDTLTKEEREYYTENPDMIRGAFRNPLPIDYAIDAITKLHNSGMYELVVATTAPWDAPESATDKMFWIQKYFPKIFHKNMIITHRKDLLMGDYLIDDRTANGAGEFKGKLIQFGQPEFPDWNSVVQYLIHNQPTDGFDYTEEDENRMNIIGQNGNDGLHYSPGIAFLESLEDENTNETPWQI